MGNEMADYRTSEFGSAIRLCGTAGAAIVLMVACSRISNIDSERAERGTPRGGNPVTERSHPRIVYQQDWKASRTQFGLLRVDQREPSADPPGPYWGAPDAILALGDKLVVTDPANARIALLSPPGMNPSFVDLPGVDSQSNSFPLSTDWLVGGASVAWLVAHGGDGLQAFSITSTGEVRGPWRLSMPENGKVSIQVDESGVLMLTFAKTEKNGITIATYRWTPDQGAHGSSKLAVVNPLGLSRIDDVMRRGGNWFVLGYADVRGEVLSMVTPSGGVNSSGEVSSGVDRIAWADETGCAGLNSSVWGGTLTIVDLRKGEMRTVNPLPEPPPAALVGEGGRVSITAKTGCPKDVYVGLPHRQGFWIYQKDI